MMNRTTLTRLMATALLGAAAPASAVYLLCIPVAVPGSPCSPPPAASGPTTPAEEPAVAPTLGGFTVPEKTMGDPSFTLTPPTSDSAGGWSYASSDPTVATVSGADVTITGAGSATITATQAAAAPYAAATATATLNVTAVVACNGSKQEFSYNPAGDHNQFAQVPAGCTSALVKAWGASGGKYNGGGGSCTGSGGFASRTLTGLTPGNSLLVVVGEGGKAGATYGGGGAGYSGYSGGGLSGVFASAPMAQAGALVVAGGGGAVYQSSVTTLGGGSGGGLAGVAGVSASGWGGGQGGTQTAGGAGGGSQGAGSALQGGTGNANVASGGGGGYWGGGAARYGAGGGGSGYAPGGSLIAGTNAAVANSTDADYLAPAGAPSCASATVTGNHGRVVITWQP